MSAKEPLKRSYSQVDRAIYPSEPPQHHDQIERKSGLDGSSPEASELPDKLTDTKIKGAISRSHSPDETETELCDFSKRPCLDEEGRLLKWKNLPYETTSTSAASSFHGDSLLMLKNFRPSFLDIDPNRLQEPKVIEVHPPSRTLAPSPTVNHSRPHNNSHLRPAAPSPPRRPSLNQLATDGQQALKVLLPHRPRHQSRRHPPRPQRPHPPELPRNEAFDVQIPNQPLQASERLLRQSAHNLRATDDTIRVCGIARKGEGKRQGSTARVFRRTMHEDALGKFVRPSRLGGRHSEDPSGTRAQ